MVKLDFSPQILLDDSYSLPDHESKPLFWFDNPTLAQNHMEKLDADPIFLHTVARLCLICTGLCARSPLFKVIPISLIPLFYKVQLYFRNTVVIFQSPLRYKIHIKVLFFQNGMHNTALWVLLCYRWLHILVCVSRPEIQLGALMSLESMTVAL